MNPPGFLSPHRCVPVLCSFEFWHLVLRKLARRPLNLFFKSIVEVEHYPALGYYSGEIKRELSACLSAWVSILASNCVSPNPCGINSVLVTYVSNSTEWKLPMLRDIENQSVCSVQLHFLSRHRAHPIFFCGNAILFQVCPCSSTIAVALKLNPSEWSIVLKHFV